MFKNRLKSILKLTIVHLTIIVSKLATTFFRRAAIITFRLDKTKALRGRVRAAPDDIHFSVGCAGQWAPPATADYSASPR